MVSWVSIDGMLTCVTHSGVSIKKITVSDLETKNSNHSSNTRYCDIKNKTKLMKSTFLLFIKRKH